MKKLLSLIIGIMLMFTTGFTLPAFAEEPVKNFDYYSNLDNYSVYKEYMETFGYNGHEAESSLPKEQDLPLYYAAKHYFTHGSSDYTVIMPFVAKMKDGMLTDEESGELVKDPAYFGFPDDWYIKSDNENAISVLYIETAGGTHNMIGFRCGSIGTYENGKMPVIRSTLDVYRLLLTLAHSDFARDHIVYDDELGHCRINIDVPFGECTVFGDPNEDGTVNARDAAEVLIEAARIGAGVSGQFTSMQVSAADVNGDQLVNSRDAAIILQYSAAVGTGDRYVHIVDFIA